MTTRKKVLIMEDESELANLYKTFLGECCDYDVVVASNGREGVDAFRASKDFDLVVTDYDMPSLNGFEAASAIKNISDNTPIVMVTGDSAEVKSTYSTQGILSQIAQKPLSMTALRSLVDSHINNLDYPDFPALFTA